MEVSASNHCIFTSNSRIASNHWIMDLTDMTKYTVFSVLGSSNLYLELDSQTSFLTPNQQNANQELQTFSHKKCSHVRYVTTQGTQTEGRRRRRTACSFSGRFEVSDSNLLHPAYASSRVRYAFNFKEISLTSLDTNNSSPNIRYYCFEDFVLFEYILLQLIFK